MSLISNFSFITNSAVIDERDGENNGRKNKN